MAEYEITITVNVPNEATFEQVEAWAKFCTGYTGSLEENNPVYEQQGSDIDAIICYVRKH